MLLFTLFGRDMPILNNLLVSALMVLCVVVLLAFDPPGLLSVVAVVAVSFLPLGFTSHRWWFAWVGIFLVWWMMVAPADAEGWPYPGSGSASQREVDELRERIEQLEGRLEGQRTSTLSLPLTLEERCSRSQLIYEFRYIFSKERQRELETDECTGIWEEKLASKWAGMMPVAVPPTYRKALPSTVQGCRAAFSVYSGRFSLPDNERKALEIAHVCSNIWKHEAARKPSPPKPFAEQCRDDFWMYSRRFRTSPVRSGRKWKPISAPTSGSMRPL